MYTHIHIHYIYIYIYVYTCIENIFMHTHIMSPSGDEAFNDSGEVDKAV